MSVPAVEEFRWSIEELREASEREGIDRHGMLGTWLAALEKVLERMAGLVEAQEEGLTKTVAEAKALCDGELAKVRELTRAANAALHQARTALIQEEVIRENLVARMIDHGYTFNGPHWDFPESPVQGLYSRPLAYESVHSLDDFQPCLDQVIHFPEEVVDRAWKRVPAGWIEGEEDTLERLLMELLRRRPRLPELISATRSARNNPFPNWQ